MFLADTVKILKLLFIHIYLIQKSLIWFNYHFILSKYLFTVSRYLFSIYYIKKYVLRL